MVRPGEVLLHDKRSLSRRGHGVPRNSSREVTRGTRLPDLPATIRTTCLDCSGP